MDLQNKIISYEIKIDSYKASVIALYSKSLNTATIRRELVIAHPKLSLEDEDTNAAGDAALTISIPEERTIYLLFDKTFTIGNLHHECIHITSFLFSLIQTTHDDSTDEVFAYLSDSIFSEIYDAVLTKFKLPKKSFLSN